MRPPRFLCHEINQLARYFSTCFYYPGAQAASQLFNSLAIAGKQPLPTPQLPPAAYPQPHQLILMDNVLHHCNDLQALLAQFRVQMHRTSRLVAVFRKPWVRLVGLQKQGTIFPTRREMDTLAALAGFAPARRLRTWRFFPCFSPWYAVAYRPVIRDSTPTLTIVIPARNEKGNIENALQRLLAWDTCPLEIIFVESHSTDGTWEEIQRVLPLYSPHFRLSAFQVEERGKGPAVRRGLAEATSELCTILDADLTMPPELLYQFYDAYRNGHADFINGNRFLYPMEGQAMRPLNYLGNRLYAALLSQLLGTRLSDSLCGTKLFRRDDYARFCRWNHDFGKFDPFGDYELLFPAALLATGMIDVPVRYRARTYGATNIFRFRHGAMLLRMMVSGFLRLRILPKA